MLSQRLCKKVQVTISISNLHWKSMLSQTELCKKGKLDKYFKGASTFENRNLYLKFIPPDVFDTFGRPPQPH